MMKYSHNNWKRAADGIVKDLREALVKQGNLAVGVRSVPHILASGDKAT